MQQRQFCSLLWQFKFSGETVNDFAGLENFY